MRLNLAGRIAAVIVAGALAVIGGFSVAFHRSPLDLFRAPVPSPQEVFHRNNVLILVEGLDYDWNAKDEEYSSQSRSDVIMAVNVDFATHQVYELSVPRDMKATMPSGEVAKINQAQSDGGEPEAARVISQWLGIPGFDRYVILRINTTKDLINAIGGVDLDPMNSVAIMHEGPNGPINYDDNWGHLHIHFKPGVQHMDGSQAVAYARFRHDWCGDPCRIKRQQQVIHAFVAKLKNDKVNTLLHAGQLIDVFNRDVQTDLTREEELSLAFAFAGTAPSDIHTAQVPYVADEVLPYAGDVIIPNEAAKAHLVRTMLLDPPVPLPSPDPAAIAAVVPSNVRVAVENGTSVPGLAARVAGELRKRGFTITSVSNGSRAVSRTHIRAHGSPYAAYRVREALGERAAAASITDEPLASPAPDDVSVVVGTDLATPIATAQQ